MGSNSKDDGDSNENEHVLEGKSATDLEPDEGNKLRDKIPSGADDWSIRFPRPQFKMPSIPSKSSSNESP